MKRDASCRWLLGVFAILLVNCGKTTFLSGGGDEKKSHPPTGDARFKTPPAASSTPANAGAAAQAPSSSSFSSACSLAITSSPLEVYELTDEKGPAKRELEMEIRDFSAQDDPSSEAKAHPDFEKFYRKKVSDRSLPTTGIVAELLGEDDAPVFASSGAEETMVTNREMFNTWYHDTPWSIKIIKKISIERKANSNIYSFGAKDSNFFPIDGQGFGNQGMFDPQGIARNFHFTTALRTTFVYRGGETFTFVGDDDLWVFVNRKLVLDLGGTHHKISQTIRLDDPKFKDKLELKEGEEYSLMIFHAERFSNESYYYIETSLDLHKPIPYEYQVKTTGSHDDRLQFSLKKAPAGMSIDPQSGLISWGPAEEASLIGKYRVVVEASDSQGCQTSQSYHLAVQWKS